MAAPKPADPATEPNVHSDARTCDCACSISAWTYPQPPRLSVPSWNLRSPMWKHDSWRWNENIMMTRRLFLC